MQNIRKVDFKEIDLNKIYKTSNDAQNKINSVHGAESVWSDGELELSYNDETGVGIVSRNGTGIGFININELKKVDGSTDIYSPQDATNVVFDGDNYFNQNIEQIQENDEVVQNTPNLGEQPQEVQPNIETIQNDDIPETPQVEQPPVQAEVEQPIEQVTPIEQIAEEVPPQEVVQAEVEQPTEQVTPIETIEEAPQEIIQESEQPQEQTQISEIWPAEARTGYFDYSYDSPVLGKKNVSSEAAAALGKITTDNQHYRIVPDGEYNYEPGTISQSDYNLLISVVAGEGANYISDMLGVTSTVFNRLEMGGDMGNSVREVLEKGYFPYGKSYIAYSPGGVNYNTNWGQEKLAIAKKTVDDAINGIRNINKNTIYYSGNGVHNKFSDVL